MICPILLTHRAAGISAIICIVGTKVIFKRKWLVKILALVHWHFKKMENGSTDGDFLIPMSNFQDFLIALMTKVLSYSFSSGMVSKIHS